MVTKTKEKNLGSGSLVILFKCKGGFLQSTASCTPSFSLPRFFILSPPRSPPFSLSLSSQHTFFAPFRNFREKNNNNNQNNKSWMKMKTCELCKRIARTHCESDRASLCWGCDYKVHSANFLVARHSRTLLCQICQSPTPWTATGLKIGPTVSVCDACVQNYNKINDNEEIEARKGDEEMESTDSFDDEEEEEDEDLEYDSGEETDCEDNQVVPWSPSSPPPTSSTNSSSDEESSSSFFSSLSSPRNQREALRKRTREDTDRCYNVNFVSRPSQANADAPPPMETVEVLEAASAAKDDNSAADVGIVDSVDSLSTMAENSLKKRRIQTGKSEISESREWVVVESINKLQQEGMVSCEVVAQLLRLREEDLSAVDHDSSDST